MSTHAPDHGTNRGTDRGTVRVPSLLRSGPQARRRTAGAR